MATLTTHTIKHEHRILNSLRKLKKPSVILQLLSIVALVFPVAPLALMATFIALQTPIFSDGDFLAALWFLGGPAGMVGLILAIIKKRNILTIMLLIYGIATYSPLLFPLLGEIISKGLLNTFYTLFFSIPVIVSAIHIGLSIRTIWLGKK